MYAAALAIALGIALIAIVRAFFLNTRAESSSRLSLPQAKQQIESLISSGRKIEAIKLHREAYGSGLLEAKDAVEAEEQRLKFEGRA